MIRLRKSLFGKLLAVVITFCLLMTSICISLMRAWHSNYHDEVDQLVNQNVARQLIEKDLYIDEVELDAGNVQQWVKVLTTIYPAADSYLVDEEGYVVATSLPHEEMVRNTVRTAPIRSFINGEAQFPIYGDDPRKSVGEEVFSAATINIPGFSARYLYLVLHRSDDNKSLATIRRSYAINEAVGVLALSALLAIAAALIVMRILTRNLHRLEEAMTAYRASGFAALPSSPLRARVRNGDEIERLTAMFWELAEKLQDHMHELQQSDDVRREILANVSHDLRTPIGTLLAHLETLTLKPDMSVEDRTQYLETSLRQCQRLGALVEQLLEAARLDAGEVHYEPEAFHVGELLQDVAQKFQLRAAQADIDFQVTRNADLPLVRGDIGLIERALDNLLDNAFQHTKSGGQISISAEQNNHGVRIMVVDNGIGFLEKERVRATERFYRADKSRSQGAGHAGLGLAIVNAIAGLHGSQLIIDSQTGAGARVSFDLPLA